MDFICKSDVAIKRFIKLIKRLSNKYCYPYFWKSLKNSFSNEFYEISIEYINNLIDFSYRGMWIGINNPIYKVFWKINLSFNMRILKYSKPIYVSCSQESFISITREYFEKLISRTLHKGKVILNEPFSSLNAKKVLKYFNSARMIIVHRDPRDSYCNLKNETSDFFPKDVEQYIKLYKYMLKQSYKNAENDDRVLRINFEDLVFKYEETKNKVFNFLGIDKSHHIDKFKHFNPEISKKNVKIWKNHPNKDEINKIFNELKEYCY